MDRYSSNRTPGAQSVAPNPAADPYLWCDAFEPGQRRLPHNDKIRKCRRCGHRLTRYNLGRECLHHPPATTSGQKRRRVQGEPAQGVKKRNVAVVPADECLVRGGKVPAHYEYHLSVARSLGYTALSSACLAIYEQTESLRVTAARLGYGAKFAVRRYIVAAGGTMRPTGRPPGMPNAKKRAV